MKIQRDVPFENLFKILWSKILFFYWFVSLQEEGICSSGQQDKEEKSDWQMVSVEEDAANNRQVK